MVTITSNAERRDGVTLVTATIAQEDDTAHSSPTRVHVESRLDGPIWPPRRQGQPAAGWDADGFDGVVPPDGRLAVGFASPADPVDPPLTITATERVSEQCDDGMDSPEAIVRGLGDPTPPSLIDPSETDDVNPITDDQPADATGSPETGSEAAVEAPAEIDSPDGTGRPTVESDCVEGVTASGGSQRASDETPPPAVAEWLSDVERRLELAEGLQRDAAVEDAIATLRTRGGADGALALAEELTTDADRLRTLEQRAGALAERAEGTAVATDALERLR